MSGDTITATFKCKECGGTVLELPDNYTDDSIARCKSCGQGFGTWGDIKAKALDGARKHVTGIARDIFKGRKRK